MGDLAKEFHHTKSVLSEDDINSLRYICKKHLSQDRAIPSFTLIDHLHVSAFNRIKKALEEHVNATIYYLNDFYIYTDNSFGAGWHMDTELFTFEHAVNAWILLSPDHVTDPLCFIAELNDRNDNYYHSLEVSGDTCTFSNFSNRNKMTCSLAAIEQERLHTPTIEIGDILTINPRRFHRTNTLESKHCLVIKFVYAGDNGVLSATQVPSMFWPEVGIFNKLVNQSNSWDGVLEGLRGELKTPSGRQALSAGFYPEKINFYKRMAQTL